MMGFMTLIVLNLFCLSYNQIRERLLSQLQRSVFTCLVIFLLFCLSHRVCTFSLPLMLPASQMHALACVAGLYFSAFPAGFAPFFPAYLIVISIFIDIWNLMAAYALSVISRDLTSTSSVSA